VPIGEDGRWLLNVEDEHSDAFAPEEMRDLEAIAVGLRSLLKRTLEYHYRSAVVSHANDAMLLVDERGVVFEVNPAAASLLRVPRERIENHPVAAFFADPQEARALLRGDSFPNHEVLMRRGSADGELVKVLLSVAKLPEETGGRIFVASDMTQIERVEQLELTQGLYREITGQVKTPMSLAISWLRRHAQRDRLGADDVSHKVIQQLQKAELTLDRMMLIERDDRHEIRHEVLIPMDDLVESVLREMPERERAIVDRTGEAADAYELRYCLQTVLSYLLRWAAEVDRIGLDIRREDAEVVVVASGRTESLQAGIAAECRSGQARAELSLGRTTLARLARRNRGRYIEAASPADRERASFGFAFPIVGAGDGR
jgi:PAS domain S-box-containing protein